MSGHLQPKWSDGAARRSLAYVNQCNAGLESSRQLWPGDGKAKIEWDVELSGEAVAQIPDEGMPTNDDVGGRSLLEPPHGIQPLLEVSMVAFYAIFEVFRRTMLNIRQDRTKSRRIALRFVGGHP